MQKDKKKQAWPIEFRLRGCPPEGTSFSGAAEISEISLDDSGPERKKALRGLGFKGLGV